MRRFIENAIGGFKYLLAVFMMYVGVLTAIQPLQTFNGALGYIYSTRITLVIFGIIFFLSGCALLYGKIKKSRKWTGRGLYAIFLIFVFATILQAIAYHFAPGYWFSNFVFAVITGALWLRWKLKTEYVNKHHFVDDIVDIRTTKTHR